MGRPLPIKDDNVASDGQLKGVPVSIGECEGIVRIVNNVDDANKLKKGKNMSLNIPTLVGPHIIQMLMV